MRVLTFLVIFLLSGSAGAQSKSPSDGWFPPSGPPVAPAEPPIAPVEPPVAPVQPPVASAEPQVAPIRPFNNGEFFDAPRGLPLQEGVPRARFQDEEDGEGLETGDQEDF